MSTLILILRCVNIFCAGLLAGGQVFPLLTIVPAIRALPPEQAIQAHQDLLEDRPDRYLRAIGVVAAVAGALLLLVRVRPMSQPWLFTAAGLAGSLAVFAVGALVEVPISHSLRAWPEDAAPEQYVQMRRYWAWGHTVRTACGLLAFFCYLAAVLADLATL
jgi:uncharacterized membrane protein